MNNRLRIALVLIASLVSLALALNFGRGAIFMARMSDNMATGWAADEGRSALALVFGFWGCFGLASLLKKSD